MTKRLNLTLAALLVVVAFWAGAYWAKPKAPATSAGSRQILYYVDPMNPAHTSDKPGLAPCGMAMEPVYADQNLSAVGLRGTNAVLPGTVQVNTAKQQLIGVKLGMVEKKALTQSVRLLARVVPEETRVFPIKATVDGWITEGALAVTGTLVHKGQTLATFYSPEFLSAAQALLFALNTKDRTQGTVAENLSQSNRINQFNLNIQQYKDSLRNLGMGALQIEELVNTRKFNQHVNIASPAQGFVIARNVTEGQRFEKGTELYRIVDLSRVWVVADLYNRDAPLVLPGIQARVSLPAQNVLVPAKLSEALPQFDNVTRTLKLRFEADNPEFALKPDMLVDVEFDVSLPEALVAPAEAVLDSGLRKTVFVDRGNGYFEPRTIQTGWRVGDYIQITQGLMAGEPIVTSGNFLLDSESRMKLAAAGVHGTPFVDPVCGMGVDQVKATAAKRTSEVNGTTYFFCNDSCKREFDANPAKYLGANKSQPITAQPATEAEIDPVCGMKVKPEKARAANRVVEHQGKTYYFCNDSCKAEFIANPVQFLNATASKPAGDDQPHH
jgi:membrane fusion protein, copper/silver efflux system